MFRNCQIDFRSGCTSLHCYQQPVSFSWWCPYHAKYPWWVLEVVVVGGPWHLVVLDCSMRVECFLEMQVFWVSSAFSEFLKQMESYRCISLSRFFSPFSNIIFRFTIYQLFIPLLLSGNSIACLYEWFVHLLITLRVFPPVGNKTVVFGHVLLFLLRISGRSVFTFLSIFQTFQVVVPSCIPTSSGWVSVLRSPKYCCGESQPL